MTTSSRFPRETRKTPSLWEHHLRPWTRTNGTYIYIYIYIVYIYILGLLVDKDNLINYQLVISYPLLISQSSYQYLIRSILINRVIRYYIPHILFTLLWWGQPYLGGIACMTAHTSCWPLSHRSWSHACQLHPMSAPWQIRILIAVFSTENMGWLMSIAERCTFLSQKDLAYNFWGGLFLL
jgi:hypothetical protein